MIKSTTLMDTLINLCTFDEKRWSLGENLTFKEMENHVLLDQTVLILYEEEDREALLVEMASYAYESAARLKMPKFCNSNYSVSYFSMLDSSETVVSRILQKRLGSKDFSKASFLKFMSGANIPLFIHQLETRKTMFLKHYILQQQRRYGLKLIVIPEMHLFLNQGTSIEKFASVSRSMKEISQCIMTPVVSSIPLPTLEDDKSYLIDGILNRARGFGDFFENVDLLLYWSKDQSHMLQIIKK